jgi:hypothetical protein
MRYSLPLAIAPFLIGQIIAVPICLSERGTVLVRVVDVHGKPVGGVEIGMNGAGGSGTTSSGSINTPSKDDGKLLLSVGADTKENDLISFALLKSPPGQDLAILSPWDNRARVPPFADKPENFVPIVVVRRNDRDALSDGAVIAILTQRILHEVEKQQLTPSSGPTDPQKALRLVAKQYKIPPDQLDSFIRGWGAKATDPYDVGLAALYERRYPEAIAPLKAALKMREQKLEEDQKKDGKAVADAACPLGWSEYETVRYEDSQRDYEECLKYRPDDPSVLNNLALATGHTHHRMAERQLLCRAFVIEEKTPGPDPNLKKLIGWNLMLVDTRLTAGSNDPGDRTEAPDLPDCGSYRSRTRDDH